MVNRAVGGSFIFCGLIAGRRRPDIRTGPLMTLTGFLYLRLGSWSPAEWDLGDSL